MNLILVVILAILLLPIGLVYPQEELFEDENLFRNLNDSKRYYLKYIDIQQSCNERGFDNEEIKQSCIEIMVKYAESMRSLFLNNTELIDNILYG